MSSEELAEAARLYDEKRYEDALAQYALLAEQGDELAARWAGWIISKGLCARNDPQEAIRFISWQPNRARRQLCLNLLAYMSMSESIRKLLSGMRDQRQKDICLRCKGWGGAISLAKA